LKKSLETLLGGPSACPQPSKEDLLSWAMTINRCLTTPDRVYRNVDHVYRVVRGMKYETDSVPILASLFHDIVYLTIDKKLPDKLRKLLSDVVDDPNDGSSTLNYRMPYRDPLVRMVRSMFDYVFGPTQRKNRNTDETNEFLSAIVAVKLLGSFLPRKTLFQLVACIEATIPFRPVVDGTLASPMEGLYTFLRRTNEEFRVGLSEHELVETVQMAAYFSNADLRSHCSDVIVFRDRQLMCMPEWKPILRHESTCTLCQIFQCFVGVIEFSNIVKSVNVFQSFRGKPAQDVIETMTKKSDTNLRAVTQYLKVRCLAVRILMDLLTLAFQTQAKYDAVLRDETAGALSFLRRVERGIGEEFTTRRREESANATTSTSSDVADEVYRCLTSPRRSCCCNWDAGETHLSAAVYARVGMDAIEASDRQASLTTDVVGTSGSVGSGDLLRLLPNDMRQELCGAVSRSLPSRYEVQIKKVIEEVSASQQE